MTFFEDMKTTYGVQVSTLMKQISTSFKKKAKQKNRRIFLLRCKHTKITPKFLNFNASHITFTGMYLENKLTDIVNNTKQNFLNLTITECTRTINMLDKLVIEKINKCKSFIAEYLISNFLKFEIEKNEKLFNNIKLKNTKKISKLMYNTQPNNVNINKSDWLENVCNTQIPNDVGEVLALGKKSLYP